MADRHAQVVYGFLSLRYMVHALMGWQLLEVHYENPQGLTGIKDTTAFEVRKEPRQQDGGTSHADGMRAWLRC